MRDSHEADVNHFEILGYVGRLRAAATPSGRDVANMSVGTHRMVREPETKRLIEKTEWHDVVAFDEVAVQVRNSVDKGTRVRITGYMRTRSWVDKSSPTKHFKHELVALAVEVQEHSGPRVEPEEVEPTPVSVGIKIRSF